MTINVSEIKSLTREDARTAIQAAMKEYKDRAERQQNGYVMKTRILQDGIEKTVDIGLGIKYLVENDTFFFMLEDSELIYDFIRQTYDDFEVIQIEEMTEYKNIVPVPFGTNVPEDEGNEYFIKTCESGNVGFCTVTPCEVFKDEDEILKTRRIDNGSISDFDISLLYYIE